MTMMTADLEIADVRRENLVQQTVQIDLVIPLLAFSSKLGLTL